MDASGLIHHQEVQESTSPGLYIGIGARLRQARERAGFSIAHVARETKISSYYLDAIEAMDRAALPPRAYALGFVRCYAEFLGLDTKEIVGAFKEHFYDDTPPLGDLSPVQAPSWMDFRLPRGVGIALVCTCALALATWYGLRMPARSEAAVPAVPEAMAGWSQTPRQASLPGEGAAATGLDGG